jgi:uncharacterized protein YkwD
VNRDYARLEVEVLAALNQVRTDPSRAVGWMQELTQFFDGMLLRKPNWPIAIRTNEGVAAVRDAIAALRSQEPVQSLVTNAALASAARDHADDQARSGQTGHAGSDGSTVSTRVSRYATWRVSLSENIDYGRAITGRDVIESLIVDDGVQDRGHRKNIYDPSARFVGIACGPHPKFTAMCVIVQAGGVSAK